MANEKNTSGQQPHTREGGQQGHTRESGQQGQNTRSKGPSGSPAQKK